MKKITLTLIACFLSTLTVSAQKSETIIDMLTSTIWKRQVGNKAHIAHSTGSFVKYDGKTEIHFDMKDGKGDADNFYRIHDCFYLSNTIDEKYDKRKECMLANGKYIVSVYRNVDWKAYDPTGERRRKGEENAVGGIILSDSEMRKEKRAQKKYLKEEVVSVHEIITLTKDELILRRIKPMRISPKTSYYKAWEGDVK